MQNETLEKLAHHLGYLRDRWADESQYEDWADYDKSIRSQLPADATAISITKRPFAVSFTVADGTSYRLAATARRISLDTYAPKREKHG